MDTEARSAVAGSGAGQAGGATAGRARDPGDGNVSAAPGPQCVHESRREQTLQRTCTAHRCACAEPRKRG